MKIMPPTTAIQRFLRRVAWLPLLTGAALCMAQSAAPARSPAEQDLFNLTNTARSEQGLAPLQWDDSLAQAAKAHAALILQNGQLSHDFPGEADLAARAGQAGAHFQTIAENIAQGSSADSIQKEWMNSPPHRANILDAKLTAVGFSVVQRGDTLYAVADFARIVPNLTNDQVEAAIAKLLVARGIQADGSNPDARKTCEMDHGSAGDTKPGFIMRWQGADLTKLPPELEERLQTKNYQRAVVGACSSPNGGFNGYTVAVLLY
jgi:uncharacterized protein YkwD